MNGSEIERIKRELTVLCRDNQIDEQLIDFDHEIDRTLTYGENFRLLKEAYNLKSEKDLGNYAKNLNQQTVYEKWRSAKHDGLSLFEFYTPFCVCIVGERRSGKTALGHQVCDRLRKAKKMPVYVYKYQKEELAQHIGYRNLKELHGLEYLNNAILWLDEPQITLKKVEKKNNDALMELMSICAHRNIILVISTSDTRWVNRGLESYVDVWCVKDIDYELVKQGSRAKYIIKQFAVLDPQAFKMQQNEYLMYYRKDEEYQSKFEVALPTYWTEDFSKPYSFEEAEEQPPEGMTENRVMIIK